MDNKKTRVLVLGGFGFIGKHLVRQLAQSGHSVTVFGHASHEARELEGKGVHHCYGDFANARELDAALRGIDVVFHLIGNTVPQSSNDNPRFDVDAHVGPTLTLLDLCVRHKVKQVVFTSSGGAVFGIPAYLPIDEKHPTVPISSYGIQKITIEHYLRLYHRLHGLRATVLRIANPYGPGQGIGRNQGLVGMVCTKIKCHETLEIWGDGSVVRDYIHISDVVTAMEKIILATDGYDIYNIGTGVGTSINEVVALFTSLDHVKLAVHYKPARPVDIPANVLDCAKFRQTFGWQPGVELAAGIKTTLESYLETR